MAAAWPEEFGGTPPDGGWDFFKDLIQEDELMRCGYGTAMKHSVHDIARRHSVHKAFDICNTWYSDRVHA